MISKVVLSLIPLIVITSAGSQPQHKPEFHINAGLPFPIKPEQFNDHWDANLSFGAGIATAVSDNVTFTASVDYNRFRVDEQEVLRDTGVSGPDRSVTSSGSYIFMFSGDWRVWLRDHADAGGVFFSSGIGFFTLSLAEIELLRGESVAGNISGYSETTLCISFGAGFDVPVAERVAVFAEARYVLGFTEDANTAFSPIKVGVKWRAS